MLRVRFTCHRHAWPVEVTSHPAIVHRRLTVQPQLDEEAATHILRSPSSNTDIESPWLTASPRHWPSFNMVGRPSWLMFCQFCRVAEI
eukprot:2546276-Prymnesium_polylepis.1